MTTTPPGRQATCYWCGCDRWTLNVVIKVRTRTITIDVCADCWPRVEANATVLISEWRA